MLFDLERGPNSNSFELIFAFKIRLLALYEIHKGNIEEQAPSVQTIELTCVVMGF